jgi:hypothetical protein
MINVLAASRRWSPRLWTDSNNRYVCGSLTGGMLGVVVARRFVLVDACDRFPLLNQLKTTMDDLEHLKSLSSTDTDLVQYIQSACHRALIGNLEELEELLKQLQQPSNGLCMWGLCCGRVCLLRKRGAGECECVCVGVEHESSYHFLPRGTLCVRPTQHSPTFLEQPPTPSIYTRVCSSAVSVERCVTLPHSAWW